MQTAPHRQPFVAHPLAQLAAAFAAGILGAQLFSEPTFLQPLSCLMASIIALICLSKRKPAAATSAVTIAFILAGVILASMEKRGVSSNRLQTLIDQGTIAAGDPVELTGVLERHPELAPGGFYLTLRAEQLRMKGADRRVSGVVTLLLPVRQRTAEEDYQRLDLRYGSRVRVMTVLNRTDNFRNPGVSKFTEYLERRGYDAAGHLKSPLLIERLDDVPVFLPLAWLYQWRQQLETRIVSQFSPDTAGVLLASLLGNRYFLSQATAERFREGGTFHVLVISGMHISFLGAMVFLLARRITRNRIWQFLLATTVLWCYALAVGAESSVVRAALMFSLIAFAPIVSRRGASLNSLGAAALVLLVWRPGDLFDPSFQLTFLSVLAIVVFGWPLMQRMSEIGSWRPTRATPCPPACSPWLRSLCESLFWSEREWNREMGRLNYSYGLFKTPVAAILERAHLQRPLRYALAAMVVSFSVQLTMLPLLIVYFHRVSLSSLILNVGVSVLMAILALVAVVGLIVGQVSSAAATPLFDLANALSWSMIHGVDPLMHLGIASARIPEYSGWSSLIYVCYCLPLAALAVLLSRWNPFAPPRLRRSRRSLLMVQSPILAQLILLAIVILHPLSAGRGDGKLRVDFLDVGQGDSALITMPDGTTLLIDGGGRPNFFSNDRMPGAGDNEPFARDTRSIGEAVVSEYLWWRGLDRIDYILATHADADHMNGLNDVVRNFSVRGALVARTSPGDPEFAKFYDTATKRGIPISVIGSEDVLRFTGATATVLWPDASTRVETRSRNNDSLVLRLQSGERSFLLTGDIEGWAETLLSGDSRLAVDVLKVPHHGSKTSSTDRFVSATAPKFAIISVGQNSMFGHPHREVVERWQRKGAEVLTTARSGMITLTTDGKDLRLQTFVRLEE